MLSRVAENLFWMARYMERSSSQLRVMRSLYVASQDGSPFMKRETLNLAFNQGASSNETVPMTTLLHGLLFDKNNDGSIISNVFKARENARSVQDHITLELWHTLNEFYLLIKDHKLSATFTEDDPITVFDDLIHQCMHYFGVIDSYMFRGEGFYFLNMGKFVERSLQSSKLLQLQFMFNNGILSVGEELLSWRYFLFAMSGYEFYLKSNAGNIVPERIFHQVLNDSLFPHSVAYCIQQLVFYGSRLAAGRTENVGKDVKYAIGKTDALLKYKELELKSEQVLLFFNSLNEHIYGIVSALNKNYFGLN